jgi:histidyl-tRNA synthetase
MVDFLREVGLAPADVVMRINSRSLLSALLVARGFEVGRHAGLFVVLDKRDKLPPEAFAAELAKVTSDEVERGTLNAISQAKGDVGLAGLAQMAEGNEAAGGELARLRRLFELLGIMGISEYCTFDMGVVRGLAYYTGVVFEGFAKGGLQRAICGGGRYGELLEVLGGPAMSGVGFGTSDVVILDVLTELNKLPAAAKAGKRVELFLIDANAELFPEVLRLAAELRRRGMCAEYSYKRQAVGKQFKQAAAANAARAVIVGVEFKERGVLAVKDMATGQQAEMTVETLLAGLRQ